MIPKLILKEAKPHIVAFWNREIEKKQWGNKTTKTNSPTQRLLQQSEIESRATNNAVKKEVETKTKKLVTQILRAAQRKSPLRQIVQATGPLT